MRFNGNGIVWDALKNRKLIDFGKAQNVNVYDEYVIEKLLELGYKPAMEFIDVEFEEVTSNKKEDKIKNIDDKSIKELKQHCKKKNYENYTNLNKSKLIKFIRGLEGV